MPNDSTVASDKLIESGDLVTLDFGAYYKGYCSDITRTVAVGQPSDQLKEIYQVVFDAQALGVAHIKCRARARLNGRNSHRSLLQQYDPL